MREIQTQTPINPGNSGGPLINNDSELIGINTYIIGEGSKGLNFAVSLSTINNFLNGENIAYTKKYHQNNKEPENKQSKKFKPLGECTILKKWDRYTGKEGKFGNDGYKETHELDCNDNDVTDTVIIDKNKNGNAETLLYDDDENGFTDYSRHTYIKDGKIINELRIWANKKNNKVVEIQRDLDNDGKMDVVETV